VGRVLRIDAAAIDRQAPFSSLGLDSLMRLELRNRLTPSLGEKLPASLLAVHPTLAALAAQMVVQLGSNAGASATRGGRTPYRARRQ
jgi:acyl carrier protein